uniref:uncharacterized protein n=1 Tax=Myxine glutinosa TaxID=7769 RepID=UPI00358E72BE
MPHIVSWPYPQTQTPQTHHHRSRMLHHRLLGVAITLSLIYRFASTAPAASRLKWGDTRAWANTETYAYGDQTVKVYRQRVIWRQRINIPCCHVKEDVWTRIMWRALYTDSQGRKTGFAALSRLKQAPRQGSAPIVNMARPGYKWGKDSNNLTTHVLLNSGTTLLLQCEFMTSQSSPYGYRPPCISHILIPHPRIESRKKPKENTYWTVTRAMAKVQNRSRCWMCMHFPHTSMTGIEMVVLPLSLRDMCSGPLRTPCLTTTLELIGPKSPAVCSREFRYTPPIKQALLDKPPDPVWVTEQKGRVCLIGKGHVQMGTSECTHTLPSDTRSREKGGPLVITIDDQAQHNVTKLTISWGAPSATRVEISKCMASALIPPHGVMFICGNKAYPYLPDQWGGTCYLGSIFPKVNLVDHFNETGYTPTHERKKRFSLWNPDETVRLDGRWWQVLLGAFFPQAGVTMNDWRIDSLALVMERIGNETRIAELQLEDELVHMRTMVMQNPVALDMLLAEKGGVCGVIDGKCCTYIPDHSEGIEASIIRLKAATQDLTDSRRGREEANNVWSSISAWFRGWTGVIVKWLLTGLAIIVGIVLAVVIMKSLIMICVRKCFTGWTPSTTTNGMLLSLYGKDPKAIGEPANSIVSDPHDWVDGLDVSWQEDVALGIYDSWLEIDEPIDAWDSDNDYDFSWDDYTCDLESVGSFKSYCYYASSEERMANMYPGYPGEPPSPPLTPPVTTTLGSSQLKTPNTLNTDVDTDYVEMEICDYEEMDIGDDECASFSSTEQSHVQGLMALDVDCLP